MKLSTLSIPLLLLCITTLVITLSANESFILLDPTNAIVATIGDVDTQFSPNSTFKIALSLMGYDMNILTNEQEPQWDFKEAYVDFDFIPAWRTAHTPASWIKNSCIWYSQLLTPLIGKAYIQNYLAKFEYGNQDFSGDLGKNNGLTNAWLNSSLKISPREQVNFLQKIIRYSLPVSRHAIDMTKSMLFIEQLPHSWSLFGKTGMGGWLIGWVEKDELSYPFALVIRDTTITPAQRIVHVKQLLQKHLPAIVSF